MRGTLRATLAMAVSTLVLCTSSVAIAVPGRGPRVSIGETATPNNRRDVAHALRVALTQEIASMRNVELSPSNNARFVLRGSITRLEQRRVQEGLSVACEVSVVVAESRNGSVRMMLRGSADARGDSDRARLERAALEAAVRGAVRPLAQTLARIR